MIKIHLCQYKDGSHAVGLHVEGLRIENWLPGDLEVKTESFDDRRSVKWLYDRLADAMKSLNNYSYDNRTNNCQVVVDIVILKLFGSKYSKMNSSNTIEGVQLSVSGLWFSFALGSFFFLFGACLIIFFGTISLPILSNYTVPCEANDFSTCQIGVGNCTWPSMEHCTLAVNYTINSLVYQSIVRINPGTIGMRFCFPNVSHLECCGLAQEKNLSKQLYCYLDPSLELAQQLPTYFQYTFEPVFLPLWILLLVFFSTLLLLALFSCVIPVSLHIGYNCFSLDDYNASFWVKTTKRKWVWKLVILFFLLILVSTICILFFGRITGQKLGMNFCFGLLFCLSFLFFFYVASFTNFFCRLYRPRFFLFILHSWSGSVEISEN